MKNHSFTPSNSKDSLCLKQRNVPLIEQLQEFIKYLSKASNKDIRKILIELNQNDFQDFLSKPGTDRFRMSKYLESVISTQRNFLEPNGKSNLGSESTKESSVEESKLDLVLSSDSKSPSTERNSAYNSSNESPLVPKRLFTSKENSPSSPTLQTLG